MSPVFQNSQNFQSISDTHGSVQINTLHVFFSSRSRTVISELLRNMTKVPKITNEDTPLHSVEE